jgi:hypothetical protein
MPVPDHASEPLRKALSALEQGNWDKRSQEGSRLNALDSIAWSLIGILSHLERSEKPAAPAPSRPAPSRRGFDELDVSPLKPMA